MNIIMLNLADRASLVLGLLQNKQNYLREGGFMVIKAIICLA